MLTPNLLLYIVATCMPAAWNHYFYKALDAALPPTEEALSTTTAIKVVSGETACIHCELYSALSHAVCYALLPLLQIREALPC
jgi:hypothetical protein